MLKIKKLSMLILMFSSVYIFSMSDQEKLKGVEDSIDSLFSAIPEYQRRAQEWTRTPGSKSMFTPKYLEGQLDRLRDLTQEAIQLRRKLGLEPALFEMRLKMLQKSSIPSAREALEMHPGNEIWQRILNGYLEEEKIIKHALNIPEKEQLERGSKESEQRIAESKRKIEESDRIIGEIDRRIEERDRKIEERDRRSEQESKESEQRIAESKRKTEEGKREIEEIRRRIEERDRKIEEVKREIEEGKRKLGQQSLPLPSIESTYNIPELSTEAPLRPQQTRTVEYTPPTTLPGRRQQTTENVRYQVPTQVIQPTRINQAPVANPRKNPKLVELKAKKEDLEQQKNTLRAQRDSYAKNSRDYKSKDAEFKNFEKNTYLPAKKAYEDYARSLGL